MGISPVNLNVIRNTQNALDSTTHELSSGKKDRKKDVAGSSIADKLDLLSRSLQQADRNIDASRGQVEFALGGISSQRESLSRVKELTLQYKNAQSDEDKQIVKEQIDAELSNIDKASQQTYNGTKPLNTNDSTNVQVGEGSSDTLTISPADTSQAALGLSGFDPSDPNALQQIDDASHKVDLAESRFASSEARLDHAQREVDNRALAAETARSRIQDVDAASIFAEKTKNEILQRAQIAMLAQGNVNASNSFRLLGS